MHETPFCFGSEHGSAERASPTYQSDIQVIGEPIAKASDAYPTAAHLGVTEVACRPPRRIGAPPDLTTSGPAARTQCIRTLTLAEHRRWRISARRVNLAQGEPHEYELVKKLQNSPITANAG